jgi:predicted Fe-S protein YdhL (DUF1289 family)
MSENNTNETVLLSASPCIGICSTTFGDDICLGCHRTYKEVVEWNRMTDEQKHAINQRLIKQSEQALKRDVGVPLPQD